MTEEEWSKSDSVGTIVDGIRRHGRFRSSVIGRKSRLAACAILRLILPQLGNSIWMGIIEATDDYSERGGSLTDIESRILEDPHVELLSRFPHRHPLLSLVQSDPFDAVSSVAREARPFLYLLSEGANGYTEEEFYAGAVSLNRDSFGNPFRPVAFDPNWRTSNVVSLARSMNESRDFSAMPILSDALQDAGCDHADILDHCRGSGPHVRGCWVVDLVLGKS
jgi:hypothetical protein